jgi:CMD domain protein
MPKRAPRKPVTSYGALLGPGPGGRALGGAEGVAGAWAQAVDVASHRAAAAIRRIDALVVTGGPLAGRSAQRCPICARDQPRDGDRGSERLFLDHQAAGLSAPASNRKAMMSAPPHDVIDTLVGIMPGTKLDAIRARRSEARKHAQASYLGLLVPEDPGGVSLQERFAVAAFVAGLHGEGQTRAFYAEGLKSSGAPDALRAAVARQVDAARAAGPYGRYPRGPLSAEDQAGPLHRVSAEARDALGTRLAAAFEHVHMLVFHPRDAAAPSLQAMLDAGWSTTDIVVISQLVSFLSFQIRVVAGLRVLASHPAGASESHP